MPEQIKKLLEDIKKSQACIVVAIDESGFAHVIIEGTDELGAIHVLKQTVTQMEVSQYRANTSQNKDLPN